MAIGSPRARRCGISGSSASPPAAGWRHRRSRASKRRPGRWPAGRRLPRRDRSRLPDPAPLRRRHHGGGGNGLLRRARERRERRRWARHGLAPGLPERCRSDAGRRLRADRARPPAPGGPGREDLDHLRDGALLQPRLPRARAHRARGAARRRRPDRPQPRVLRFDTNYAPAGDHRADEPNPGGSQNPVPPPPPGPGAIALTPKPLTAALSKSAYKVVKGKKLAVRLHRRERRHLQARDPQGQEARQALQGRWPRRGRTR